MKRVIQKTSTPNKQQNQGMGTARFDDNRPQLAVQRKMMEAIQQKSVKPVERNQQPVQQMFDWSFFTDILGDRELFHFVSILGFLAVQRILRSLYAKKEVSKEVVQKTLEKEVSAKESTGKEVITDTAKKDDSSEDSGKKSSNAKTEDEAMTITPLAHPAPTETPEHTSARMEEDVTAIPASMTRISPEQYIFLDRAKINLYRFNLRDEGTDAIIAEIIRLTNHYIVLKKDLSRLIHAIKEEFKRVPATPTDTPMTVNLTFASGVKQNKVTAYRNLERDLKNPINYNHATGQPRFRKCHFDDTGIGEWKLQADAVEMGKGSVDRLHLDVNVTGTVINVHVVGLSLNTH